MQAPPPTIAPPPGFPKSMLVILLFIQAIKNGLTFFLVFHNGKFELAEIEGGVLQEMMIFLGNFFRQIRRGQTDFPWQDICTEFKGLFHSPLMILNGQLWPIPWFSFILGPRNVALKISSSTVPQEIVAIYRGESQTYGNSVFESRHTKEIFDVPNTCITRLPTSVELDRSDKEFAARNEAEAATETSKALQKQREERGKIVKFPGIQHHYPLLPQGTLKILFILCQKCGISPDFSYSFNLLVLRFLPFFNQLSEQPLFSLLQLSEQDNKAFKEFEEKYNTAKRDDIPILGSVIKSKTGRFQASNLPDHLRRLFEYFCSLLDIESPTQEDVNAFLKRGDVYFEQLARNMSTISGNVLEFPDSYWTQPEFGVVLKNSKNTMLQSLFKMPSSFPSDVFV